MSDISLDFSDDNLSLDLNSDIDESHISFASKKKKSSKKKTNLKKSKKIPFSSQPPPQFNDKSFEMFSNPTKRRNEEIVQNNDSDNEDIQNEDEVDELSNEGNFENNYEEYEEEPSPGYNSIEDEKQDLVYKFYRLEQKGINVGKKFNLHSDISEMRSEYKKITRDAEVNSSLKFSKRMLLAVVSGAEFLNKRYDPLGVELNGWSESVMENMGDGDYDNVFERLHDKYAGKVNTPPELELMLSLAGSAIMFHMTSTMFKQLPNMNDISKQNPEMMQNLMQSMSKMMNQNQTSNQPMPNQNMSQSYQPPQSGQHEMKGPSINLGGIFPGMGPPPPASSSQMPYDIPESVLSDSGSESSNESIRNVSFTEGGTQKRGRKAKINADKHNTINI